jgi:hypothetical protein
MNQELTAEELAELIPSRSSVLTKVPLETRRELNRAIIFRNPMTYEATYHKFDLEKLGVSYTAFYYYARRIRMASGVSELNKLKGDTHELIPEAVRQSVLETALDHALAPKHLHHAAKAYKDVELAHVARRRIDLAEKIEEKREENWLARESVRQQNRLALEDRRHGGRMEIAKLKAEVAREAIQVSREAISDSKRKAQAAADKKDPSGARYGRDPQTGRPYTRREFMVHLRRAVYDIYGLNMPGEKNLDGTTRDPDTYEDRIDENGDYIETPEEKAERRRRELEEIHRYDPDYIHPESDEPPPSEPRANDPNESVAPASEGLERPRREPPSGGSPSRCESNDRHSPSAPSAQSVDNSESSDASALRFKVDNPWHYPGTL